MLFLFAYKAVLFLTSTDKKYVGVVRPRTSVCVPAQVDGEPWSKTSVPLPFLHEQKSKSQLPSNPIHVVKIHAHVVGLG